MAHNKVLLQVALKVEALGTVGASKRQQSSMHSLLVAFKELLGCEDLGTLSAREATTLNLCVVLTGVNVQACLAPKSRRAYFARIGLDIGITVVLL